MSTPLPEAPKPPTKAQIDDFWRRQDAVPLRWGYAFENDGKTSYFGPFDTEEQAAEYADNSDLEATVFCMKHPDDINAAIHANNEAFHQRAYAKRELDERANLQYIDGRYLSASEEKSL